MSVRLRLVSANLANGVADPEAFVALMETLEPDVVAVQELAPAQADALARLLPFGKLEPAHDHTGMGVALRDSGSVRYVSLPYRGAYVTELDGVEVVNVHIAAPHIPPFWRALARRRGQLRGLQAYLAASPRDHRAIVGDLNSTAAWPFYRRLTARFADAATQAARRAGRAADPTWAPWARGPRLLRIDHALVRGLTTHAVRVEPIRGSDHWALVVDLSPARDATGI